MNSGKLACRFRTTLSPEAVRERLEASIGRPDRNMAGAVLGRVAPDSASIYRRPREGISALPLRIDWIADGEGCLVTCRMRQPDDRLALAWRIGVGLLLALSAWWFFAFALKQAGRNAGTYLIMFVAWCLFVCAVGLFTTLAIRSTYRDERVILLAHARQALKGGALEEIAG